MCCEVYRFICFNQKKIFLYVEKIYIYIIFCNNFFYICMWCCCFLDGCFLKSWLFCWLWTSQKKCWLFCWLWTNQQLNWQQNSRGRNWMPMQFFFFFFCPSLHVTSTPPQLPRPVRVSTSSELYPDTECLGIQFFNLLTCDLWDTTPCQRSPTLIPREAEDFPRGDNHSKHVPLPTYLAWLQPICYNS